MGRHRSIRCPPSTDMQPEPPSSTQAPVAVSSSSGSYRFFQQAVIDIIIFHLLQRVSSSSHSCCCKQLPFQVQGLQDSLIISNQTVVGNTEKLGLHVQTDQASQIVNVSDTDIVGCQNPVISIEEDILTTIQENQNIDVLHTSSSYQHTEYQKSIINIQLHKNSSADRGVIQKKDENMVSLDTNAVSGKIQSEGQHPEGHNGSFADYQDSDHDSFFTCGLQASKNHYENGKLLKDFCLLQKCNDGNIDSVDKSIQSENIRTMDNLQQLNISDTMDKLQQLDIPIGLSDAQQQQFVQGTNIQTILSITDFVVDGQSNEAQVYNEVHNAEVQKIQDSNMSQYLSIPGYTVDNQDDQTIKEVAVEGQFAEAQYFEGQQDQQIYSLDGLSDRTSGFIRWIA